MRHIPPKSGRGWVGFIVLAGFLFSGCAQTAKDSPAPFTTETVTPEGYSFPHPENVAEASVHGLWVMRSGSSLCTKCHKTDADATLPGPRCDSCHAVYPHATGWATAGLHSQYVDENGISKCQGACHGTDLAGGLSGVSCTKCHGTYPHVTGWTDTQSSQFHGVTALGDGKNVCKLCHGDNFAGGQSDVTCYDAACHAPYPHASGWLAASSSTHGPIVNTEGSTQCEACHGTNNSGSIFSAFCNTCHSQHLSSPTTCKGCHEAGKGLPSGSYRPSDSIHPSTTDCVGCHNYATGDFKILRGETIDFTQSPHADTTGAFKAESDSTSCMRCHTSTGFKDYIHDGSQDAAILGADVPDPLTCTSCHNADTASYADGVTIDTSGFTPGDNPATYKRTADGGSGTHISLTVGREGVCIRCHAPRSSDGAIKVNAWVYGMTADTAYTSASTYTYAQYPSNTPTVPAGKVSSNQNRASAVTFHYIPVLATFYGNDAKQGFQYATDPNNNVLTYVGKNNLMTGYDTCIKCHNPHTTEVQPAKCVSCHTSVTTTADYRTIRSTGSDYDGDGNTSEGMYDEVEGVKAKLLTAIQNYASLQRAIAFSPATSSSSPWRRADDLTKVYDKFTPRLIKALYNYHLAYRESGAYVHNSKYIVQLMYDSIRDLNAAHGMTQVDMTGMVRP